MKLKDVIIKIKLVLITAILLGLQSCTDGCKTECSEPYIYKDDEHLNYLQMVRVNEKCVTDCPTALGGSGGTTVDKEIFMLHKYENELINVTDMLPILDSLNLDDNETLDYKKKRFYVTSNESFFKVYVWDLGESTFYQLGETYDGRVDSLYDEMEGVSGLGRFPISIQGENLFVDRAHGIYNNNFEMPFFYFQNINTGEITPIEEYGGKVVRYWNNIFIYEDDFYGINVLSKDTAIAYRYVEGGWDSLAIALDSTHANFGDRLLEAYSFGIEVVDNQIQVEYSKSNTRGFLISENFNSYRYDRLASGDNLNEQTEFEVFEEVNGKVRITSPESEVIYSEWRTWE